MAVSLVLPVRNGSIPVISRQSAVGQDQSLTLSARISR